VRLKAKQIRNYLLVFDDEKLEEGFINLKLNEESEFYFNSVLKKNDWEFQIRYTVVENQVNDVVLFDINMIDLSFENHLILKKIIRREYLADDLIDLEDAIYSMIVDSVKIHERYKKDVI